MTLRSKTIDKILADDDNINIAKLSEAILDKEEKIAKAKSIKKKSPGGWGAKLKRDAEEESFRRKLKDIWNKKKSP